MRLGPLALVFAAGCTLSPQATSATADVTTTSPPSGTDSAGTTSAAATDPTTTTATEQTTTTDTTTTTPCGFLDCPAETTAASPTECDVWTQDCPDGQKCAPWAEDGGNAWNAYKCTDIVPNPGKPGDACTAEGNGVSGVDSCEKAALCWEVSPDTGMGTCIGFCMGSPEAPTCPLHSQCVISGGGILILCHPNCDPLAQDCPDMEVCVPLPLPDRFSCVLDGSGAAGQQNDPCEYANACDPGLGCVDPSFAVECDPLASGCCLPFCDLNNPTCTNQGATCVSWYEPDPPPPGYDYFGVCRLPP